MRRPYKISRWLHKYLGLVLLLFLTWMSVSGVILNHRDLVRHVSVPKWMVPKQYHPDNWNRGAMKGIVWDSLQKGRLFVYGRQGIYVSNDKGKSFTAFMKGDFPSSSWGRRTNHLLWEQESQNLIAATNSGCYQLDFSSSAWKQIELPDKNAQILKIVKTKDQLIFVSNSLLFTSKSTSLSDFELFIPGKTSDNEYILLIRLFLELHDGSIWGLPGKLLWDVAGIILFFLCISAFYIWYYPKRWKRQYRKKNTKAALPEKKRRSFFLKYHKKLGWYAATFLFITFFTGMFLRPPLLISIAKGKFPEKYYPSIENNNPWHKKIRNAFYDSLDEQLILDCTDGIWAGTINGQFRKLELPVRIFAMGTTVFEEEKPGTWLIGSFGGLQRVNMMDRKATAILQSRPSGNPGRPGSVLVNGYISMPDSTEYILAHYKGICNTKGKQLTNVFVMPEKIKEHFKMPLWNFLFELHNARIFKGLLGGFYMLIIPIGGLLALLILLSGIFDYWFVKLKKRKS